MRHPVPLALAAAALLVVAGASPALACPSAVTVTTSASHHLHFSSTTIASGVVRFDVRGPSAADESLQLARPKHGATAAQLVADGNALNSTGSAAGIEHDFEALGGVTPGHSLWVHLHAGTYYAIDTGAETATVDEVVVLHVTGPASSRRTPHANAVLAAVHDMDWAKRPSRIPAAGHLRFENRSSEYHFLDLARLKNPHTTVQQVLDAIKKNDESIVDQSSTYSTGVLSPHRSQTGDYRLKPGTYAMLCFWPDEHGVPHALMGMIRLIHVG